MDRRTSQIVKKRPPSYKEKKALDFIGEMSAFIEESKDLWAHYKLAEYIDEECEQEPALNAISGSSL